MAVAPGMGCSSGRKSIQMGRVTGTLSMPQDRRHTHCHIHITSSFCPHPLCPLWLQQQGQNNMHKTQKALTGNACDSRTHTRARCVYQLALTWGAKPI